MRPILKRTDENVRLVLNQPDEPTMELHPSAIALLVRTYQEARGITMSYRDPSIHSVTDPFGHSVSIIWDFTGVRILRRIQDCLSGIQLDNQVACSFIRDNIPAFVMIANKTSPHPTDLLAACLIHTNKDYHAAVKYFKAACDIFGMKMEAEDYIVQTVEGMTDKTNPLVPTLKLLIVK